MYINRKKIPVWCFNRFIRFKTEKKQLLIDSFWKFGKWIDNMIDLIHINELIWPEPIICPITIIFRWLFLERLHRRRLLLLHFREIEIRWKKKANINLSKKWHFIWNNHYFYFYVQLDLCPAIRLFNFSGIRHFA